MVPQDSMLVTLVKLVDRLPMPLPPAKRGRGHPKVYTDRVFLKGVSHHDRASRTYRSRTPKHLSPTDARNADPSGTLD
jgi:hypothetical protein